MSEVDSEPAACAELERPRSVAIKVSIVLALALAWWWAHGVGVDLASVARGLAGVADSPWGLPVTLGAFVALGLVGVPQVALIAAAAAAFGPGRGFVYAYTANLASAAVGHELGRWLGLASFERRASPRMLAWGRELARHGFAASALVRVVPAGPFLVVNAFAGAVGVSRAAFLGGTALGSLPKVALVSCGTAGLVAWSASGSVAWALVGVGALIALGLLVAWGRRRRWTSA